MIISPLPAIVSARHAEPRQPLRVEPDPRLLEQRIDGMLQLTDHRPIRRRSTSHCRAPGSQTPPALRISSSYCCGHRTITQPTPSVPNTTGPMLCGTSASA